MTDNNRVIAIVIYAVAASTDWMDGQIARMTEDGLVAPARSWIPSATVRCCSPAYLLVVRGELPIWVCVLIIGRDIYLASARLSFVIITVAPSMSSFPERLPLHCS